MEPRGKRAPAPTAEALEGLLRTDAYRILQLVRRIAERQARQQPAGRELARLDTQIGEARQRADRRRALALARCTTAPTAASTGRPSPAGEQVARLPPTVPAVTASTM